MVNYPLSVSFNLTSNLHDRPSEPSSNPEYLSGNQPHATFLKLHDVHSILLEEIYQLMETTATSLPKTTFFIRFLRLRFSHQLIRIDNLNRMSNSVMQIWHKISEIRFFESGRISFRSQLNFLINCNGSFTSRSKVESNAENQNLERVPVYMQTRLRESLHPNFQEIPHRQPLQCPLTLDEFVQGKPLACGW